MPQMKVLRRKQIAIEGRPGRLRHVLIIKIRPSQIKPDNPYITTFKTQDGFLVHKSIKIFPFKPYYTAHMLWIKNTIKKEYKILFAKDIKNFKRKNKIKGKESLRLSLKAPSSARYIKQFQKTFKVELTAEQQRKIIIYRIKVSTKLLQILFSYYPLNDNNINKLLNYYNGWQSRITIEDICRLLDQAHREQWGNIPPNLSFLELHDWLWQEEIKQQTPKFVFEHKKETQQFIEYLNQQGIKAELPKDTQELELWGRILHNCIHSYARQIRKNESVVFTIKEKEKIRWAVEVEPNRFLIRQYVSHCNARAPEEKVIELGKAINNWLKMTNNKQR